MDNSEHDYFTIEPGNGGGFTVYGYGQYPEYSVLAGQTRRVFIDHFETVEAATSNYPNAEVQDSRNLVAAAVSPMPPAWFDEAAAGEHWDEE